VGQAMRYPQYRPRRLRRTAALRGMVRETRLHVSDLVLPILVRSGRGERRAVPSMSGVQQFSPDRAVSECREAAGLGVPAVLIFGIPDVKDERASSAYDDQGVVQQALREIRAALPDLVLVTDVCLCEYTDHGMDGRMNVLNDPALELLSLTALSRARTGAAWWPPAT